MTNVSLTPFLFPSPALLSFSIPWDILFKISPFPQVLFFRLFWTYLWITSPNNGSFFILLGNVENNFIKNQPKGIEGHRGRGRWGWGRRRRRQKRKTRHDGRKNGNKCIKNHIWYSFMNPAIISLRVIHLHDVLWWRRFPECHYSSSELFWWTTWGTQHDDKYHTDTQ